MDEKEFMVDSVHRYNKKIESLNYEYNHMLAQTVRQILLDLLGVNSWRIKGRILRGDCRS